MTNYMPIGCNQFLIILNSYTVIYMLTNVNGQLISKVYTKQL